MQDIRPPIVLKESSFQNDINIKLGEKNVLNLGHGLFFEKNVAESVVNGSALFSETGGKSTVMCGKTKFDLKNELSLNKYMEIKLSEKSECDKAFSNLSQDNVEMSVVEDVMILKTVSLDKGDETVKELSDNKEKALGKKTEEILESDQRNKNFVQFHNSRRHDGNQNASNKDTISNNLAQKYFVCKICNNCFVSFNNFKCHVKSHANLAEFSSCQACNKSSNEKSNNKEQEKNNSSRCECKYICDICKASFIHEYGLYIHCHVTHSKMLIPKEMSSSDLLLNPTERFVCKLCGVSFKRNRDLNKHVNNIHNSKGVEKKYKCSVCNKTVTEKSSLNYHMRIHTGEKPWSCELCGSSFIQKSTLSRHMRTHTGERPYECKVCLKTFASSNIFRNHLRVHTREKPFICDICEKAFWRKEALNEHYIIHTGERPHVCDVCDKVFKYPSKLKTHYKTHTQDKPYECKLCKKRFLMKHQYKEHFYTHTGEKPYVCTFADCGKAFSKAAILGRHNLIHTGQQPYVCELCNRGFNQKTSLNRHYVVHTQEKPYSCEFCEQSFTQKAYLQLHKRQKHTELNSKLQNIQNSL